jgi:hypothetical protein
VLPITRTTAQFYGLYVLHCPCGWKVLKRGGGSDLFETIQCPACGRETHIDEKENGVADRLIEPLHGIARAEMIATIADLRSRRVQEHAERHDLLLWRVSKSRYVVLRLSGNHTVKYESGTARVCRELDAVAGPADYQTCMKYLRDQTPELPAYLAE